MALWLLQNLGRGSRRGCRSERLGVAPKDIKLLGERDLLVDAHWRLQAGRRTCAPAAFAGLVLALEELILAAQKTSAVGAAFAALYHRL